MAALPRVERFCYFRTLLARVENVLEAATAPSPKTLETMAVQRTVNQTITPEKTISYKTPFGKLQRISECICVIKKNNEICTEKINIEYGKNLCRHFSFWRLF
jgi:hypothetical protein